MLFLIALPAISSVALVWRFLQIYAPSNVLIRTVRSAPPRWHTVLYLFALAIALLVTMHVVSQAIERGASDWLNAAVLVLAWDAIKVATLAIVTIGRCVLQAVGCKRSVRRTSSAIPGVSDAVDPPESSPRAETWPIGSGPRTLGGSCRSRLARP